DGQREAWCQLIEAFDEGSRRHRQLAPFPADREIPTCAAGYGVQVRLLHRPRQWGACWLACYLYEKLELGGDDRDVNSARNWDVRRLETAAPSTPPKRLDGEDFTRPDSPSRASRDAPAPPPTALRSAALRAVSERSARQFPHNTRRCCPLCAAVQHRSWRSA